MINIKLKQTIKWTVGLLILVSLMVLTGLNTALADTIIEQQNLPQPILLEEAEYLDRQIETLSAQGKYASAFPLAEHALTLRQIELGSTHPEAINSLNKLIELAKIQGKFDLVTPLFEQALNTWENSPVPDDKRLNSPELAFSLNKVADNSPYADV